MRVLHLTVRPAVIASILTLLAGILVPASSQAATYTCVTKALRGNKWICQDNAALCTFSFIVNDREKTLMRRGDERNPLISVIVDKWDDRKIVAHEDQIRLDSRFIEQYFYKIELDTGNFVMANEYRTNSGRYLTQDDINATDKKRFSYYRPRLFSENGHCRFGSAK